MKEQKWSEKNVEKDPMQNKEERKINMEAVLKYFQQYLFYRSYYNKQRINEFADLCLELLLFHIFRWHDQNNYQGCIDSCVMQYVV